MRFGRFAAAATLAVVAIAVGAARGHAQTIKIGLINSNTGFLAQPGDEMEKGISLYVKTHEKDLPPGVKVELVRRDDTAAPEVGKRVAQELITRERVQALLGIVGSPIAAAVAPLTAAAKIPLAITNAAGVAIPRISPYVARVSFTLWQQAYPLGKWAAQKGWKKAYTAVSDFIPGHDSEAAFTKAFTDAGGQMVGAVRFPPSNPDFIPFVQRVKDAAPDVLFIFVPAGAQATGMMKAIKDLKLREAKIAVVSTQDLVPEEELPNMGDTPLDLITSGIYSVAGQRPANAAFLAAWNAEYGTRAIPDFLSVGGWDGAAALFNVIKQTNGKFDGDKAMAILKGWKHESPRGPIMIDPDTRDIIQNVYRRRTKMKDGKLANVDFDTIPNVKPPGKELNPPK